MHLSSSNCVPPCERAFKIADVSYCRDFRTSKFVTFVWHNTALLYKVRITLKLLVINYIINVIIIQLIVYISERINSTLSTIYKPFEWILFKVRRLQCYLINCAF